VIRQQVAQRDRQDAVWQPRFAYSTAAVILIAFALVSLPLWLVFYRISGAETNNGQGPVVADLVGLSMLLMGGLLTAAAAWVIIVEMRGRVRMVDRLARTSERETLLVQVDPQLLPMEAPTAGAVDDADEKTQVIALQSADEDTVSTTTQPTVPVIVAPPTVPTTTVPTTGVPTTAVPSTVPTSVAAADHAPPSAAATLEASSKLLQSFSRVLRAFSQLPAQVAMLAVALSLFVGATLLSLD
jgi:hypothetical protein